MLSFNNVSANIKANEKDILTLRTFELNNLKQVLSLMNENDWNGLSFNIQMKKEIAKNMRN